MIFVIIASFKRVEMLVCLECQTVLCLFANKNCFHCKQTESRFSPNFQVADFCQKLNRKEQYFSKLEPKTFRYSDDMWSNKFEKHAVPPLWRVSVIIVKVLKSLGVKKHSKLFITVLQESVYLENPFSFYVTSTNISQNPLQTIVIQLELVALIFSC